MSLVSVAVPQSESELAVMLSILEADKIPAFVQNGGFGSLLPGPQINIYNARRIMVPSESALAARDALAVLAQPVEDPLMPPKASVLDKLRMFIEFLLFGWFIPSYRQRKPLSSSRNVAT